MILALLKNWKLILTVITIISSLGGIAYGVHKFNNWKENLVTEAVDNYKLESAVEMQRIINLRDKALQEQARREKEEIENRLTAERRKVRDLQRMLLIDHDLDRLLQQKPGLVLPRVNQGTEDILKELEEATQ